MLEVVLRGQFKKDYKLAKRRGYNMQEIQRVMRMLAMAEPLPAKYYDHALTGNYVNYRECHIAPDWLLIYKVHDDQIFFARTGTHADLFE